MMRHKIGMPDAQAEIKNFLKEKKIKVLESATKKQIQIFNELKKSSTTIRIDPINKKKLNYPTALYPKENCALEWWYFTGHLESGKERFGYEFCIFKFHPQEIRFGIIPLSYLHKEPFLAIHNAITDKKNKTFNYAHSNGLVHKNKIDYTKIALEMDTSSLELDEKNNTFTIQSKEIQLELKPTKKIVKHFNEGHEVLYTPPPHKTYYLSFSRLETKGRIKIKNKEYKVSGTSWFDHQKMRMQRNSPLQGWDWFSVHFDDNTELMFIVMKDGKGINPKFNRGTYINKESKLINLGTKDVKIESTSTWKSKKTGINYPSSWKIKIPSLKLDIHIKPYVEHQEIESRFTTFLSYWEGACKVTGTKAGKKIKGESYVELVGYDNRLMTKIIQSSTK